MPQQPGDHSELLLLRARVENAIASFRVERQGLLHQLADTAEQVARVDAAIGRLESALDRVGDEE